MSRRFWSVLLISLPALISGCADGRASAPGKADVAGVYTLSEKSGIFLTRIRHYVSVPRSFIDLHSDGKAVVEGMPDCYLIDFDAKQGSFLSGHGTWQIEATDFGYGVTLDIAPGGSLPAGIYHASTLLLKGKAAPFALQVGIGDPDSNEWLVLEPSGS